MGTRQCRRRTAEISDERIVIPTSGKTRQLTKPARGYSVQEVPQVVAYSSRRVECLLTAY
jgi:hypothetical protein